MLDPGAPAGGGPGSLDPVTEQFRMIRANLLAVPPERRPRSILLTSAGPREGVSYTTHRLGSALAETGDRRVLLVDANLRDPSLESLLAGPPEGGLTELLRGEDSPTDWIRPTLLDHLDVLPAGTPPGNPTELLAHGAARKLVRALREEYDFVLLDTPALATASDAAVLGRHCDAALLVVRLNRTAREAVASALDQLGQSGVSVLGCVLTGDPDAPASRARRYGYGAPGVRGR